MRCRCGRGWGEVRAGVSGREEAGTKCGLYCTGAETRGRRAGGGIREGGAAQSRGGGAGAPETSGGHIGDGGRRRGRGRLLKSSRGGLVCCYAFDCSSVICMSFFLFRFFSLIEHTLFWSAVMCYTDVSTIHRILKIRVIGCYRSWEFIYFEHTYNVHTRCE